ncbi:Photosystem II reaction center proteins PsbY, chloroplastic-like protein [Drosera capensis]
MAAAATMATLSMKCYSLRLSNTINNNNNPTPRSIITASSKQPSPSTGLIISKSLQHIAPTTLAGAFFAALSTCEPAMAAQKVAEIAEGDNRGLALLLPIIPAIAWVLFNILQPALNQINRMRSDKALIVGLGLSGGLAASSGCFFDTPHADAGEMVAEVAAVAAGGGDNRGKLLLFVVLPAIAWVLYNILQPALNQLNRMRSDQ